MFDNIGQKIKKVAKMQYIFFTIFNFVGGIILLFTDIGFLGFIMILIAMFGTPIMSLLLYGFGELIDRITEISMYTRNNSDNNHVLIDVKSRKIDCVCDFIYSKKYKAIIILSLIIIMIVGITFAYFSATVSYGSNVRPVDVLAYQYKIRIDYK